MRSGFLAAALLAGLLILVGGLGLAALGLITVERHTGYFAPVWDGEADGIFYVERSTLGVTWGFGWEHFSPPAYSYVLTDDFRLRHLELDATEPATLGHWAASPVKHRVTREYRGRIFNAVSARVEATVEGASYTVAMSIPRVPASEHWSLEGTWSKGAGAGGGWREVQAGSTAAPEQVLAEGIEVMAVPGKESYPAAILAVGADGDARVLVRNDDFPKLYPKGVPPEVIAERSRREEIERAREFRRVHGELVARYRGEGLGEGEAILSAYRDMEELGFLPKRPRLVAAAVERIPRGARVFEIPPDYFKVGLFQDIAAAIAAPGTGVDTDTGSYLKYHDDETGPHLKRWREEGNDSFVVRTGGRTYVMTVSRPQD